MSSVTVFEAAIRIKSMCMIKSWLKTKKENIEIKFLHKSPTELGLGIKFTVAKASWWYHLTHVTHIASLRVRHC